ncbi:hypothetical protein KI387_037911, partial [Taxus chinensis]
MDRASILGDAIEYLKELLQRINDLHTELEGSGNGERGGCVAVKLALPTWDAFHAAAHPLAVSRKNAPFHCLLTPMQIHSLRG